MRFNKVGTTVVCLGTLALAVGLFCAPAQALTLSGVDGDWINVVGGTNVTYVNGVATTYGNMLQDQVRWGTTAGIQSGLGFTGVDTPQTFAIDEVFEIGELVHFNRPIAVGSNATSADLSIDLTFSDPAGIDKTFTFTFEIDETPNNTEPPSDPANNDIIDFPFDFATQTFVIDEVAYTLRLLGFGDSPDNLVEQFSSVEGSDNPTLLFGVITTAAVAPIPEPGTLLLLGGGLLGLLTAGRKMRR